MMRFSHFDLRDHPAFGPWVAQARRHPSWPLRTAVKTAILVAVIPLVFLVVVALLVSIVVFVVLSTVNRLFEFFRRITPMRGNDGRENVRVMDRS